MSDLAYTQITSITIPEPRLEVNELPKPSVEVLPADDEPPIDVEVIKFVLDSVIDFLETLTLTGETLQHAGQLLRDVEDVRGNL